MELGYLEPADKRRLADRILGAFPAKHAAMLKFLDRYPDLPETPAQFQEWSGQIVLACFWRDGRQDAAAEQAPPVALFDPWRLADGPFAQRVECAAADPLCP